MRIARSQNGVIHKTQALGAGLSATSLKRLIQRGEWTVIRPATYLLESAPRSWLAEVTAACLSANKGPAGRSRSDGVPVAASHRCAGRLWELDGVQDDVIELTVPRSARIRWGGITAHHRNVPRRDITLRGAVAVTTPARTLLDLASVLSPEKRALAFESARRRNMISVDRLIGRIPANAAGAPRLRALLESSNQNPPTESALEASFERLLVKARVPLPERQFPIRRDDGRFIARVDFAYRRRRLVIELDGYAYHSGRRAWHSDLARQNELTRAGWTVLRFTSEDLRARPDYVVSTVVSLGF